MRAIWTGSISFGLVNIPVRLYTAAKERALKFRMIDKDTQSPISYLKVRSDDKKEVPFENIVKAYEVEKGEFVVLKPEDFKKAGAKKTETIDILLFADEEDIDPMYFEKPYWVEPAGKQAAKAYGLLRDALFETGKVAVASYVLRDKQHIGIIKTASDALMLDQMRYSDEMSDGSELTIPEKINYSKKELKLAESLIEKQTEKFNIKEFKDTYSDALKKVIQAKAKGTLAKLKTPKEAKPVPARDILEALKKSLAEEERAKTR